jgi:hypothetical protein
MNDWEICNLIRDPNKIIDGVTNPNKKNIVNWINKTRLTKTLMAGAKAKPKTRWKVYTNDIINKALSPSMIVAFRLSLRPGYSNSNKLLKHQFHRMYCKQKQR